MLVEDETTSAALKEPVVKELTMKEHDLADKLRQIPTSMTGGDQPPPRDDKGIVMDGLQERLLKELAKYINVKTQAILPQIKNEPVTPERIKKEPVTPAKPETSKIPVLTSPSQKVQKRKENFLFPHCKSIARSWNDSKNLVTGNLGEREVKTCIKRLKMTKPQSRAKAKARTAKKKKRR